MCNMQYESPNQTPTPRPTHDVSSSVVGSYHAHYQRSTQGPNLSTSLFPGMPASMHIHTQTDKSCICLIKVQKEI